VSDVENSQPALPGRGEDDLHHLTGRDTVQLADDLVREQQVRLVGQGTATATRCASPPDSCRG
jgi:hypothetical protein